MSSLNEGERYILTKLIPLDGKPTTTEIKEDSTIQDLWSENYVNEVLNKLSEEKYLERHGGNPIRWSLDQKGRDHIEKLEKRKENAKKRNKPETDYTYKEMVQEFSLYWDEHEKEIAKVEKRGKPAEISLQELEKSYSPDLADDLIKEPQTVLEAAEESLQKSPLISKKNPTVRVNNIPKYEDRKIREITPENKDELVTVKGVLETVSKTMLQYTGGLFSCTKCNKKYEKAKEPGEKFKSPYKCDACNCRKFEIEEKYDTPVIVASLRTEPGEETETIPLRIQGQIASDLIDLYKKTGQSVRVIGILDYEKRNNKDEFYQPKIRVKTIEQEENKWDEIDVEKETIEKFQEIKQDMGFKKWIDYIIERFAAEKVIHQKTMKEGFLNGILGRTESSDLGNLSILIVGDPGTSKSQIASWTKKNIPKVVYSVGQGSTEVGLTAAVRKNELTGAWVAEAGDIPQANKGIHITDEVDNLDEEDYDAFGEALSSNQITISKANIKTTLEADISEIAMGNPKNGRIDPYEPFYKQIPIRKSEIINRFDIVLAIKEEDTLHNKTKRREITEKIIQDYMSENDRKSFETTLEEYIQLLSYCRNIEPSVTSESKQMIEQYFDKLVSTHKASGNKSSTVGFRRVNTLVLMSRVYARLDFSNKVEEKHIRRAKKFYDNALRTLELNAVEDGLDALESANNRKLTLVKDEIKNSRNPEKPLNVQELAQNVSENYNLSVPEVKAVIEQLKKDGEIFEPKSGHIQST